MVLCDSGDTSQSRIKLTKYSLIGHYQIIAMIVAGEMAHYKYLTAWRIRGSHLDEGAECTGQDVPH